MVTHPTTLGGYSANIFNRFSGRAFILAACFLLLTFLPDTNFLFLALGRLGVSFWLLATLFITFGLGGLYVRYNPQLGHLGQLALGLGILGGAAGVIAHFLFNVGYLHSRVGVNYPVGLMFTGLFLFGLEAWQKKTMPWGNWLPVLAGFWFPTIIIWSMISPPTFVPVWLSFSFFLGMAIPLALFGYLLPSSD